MVALSPYFHAQQYERGLRLLALAYTTSNDALKNDLDCRVEDLIGHREAIARGEIADTIEYNDGFVIITGNKARQLRADALFDALAELKAAFAIAFFHHWERSVCQWAGKHLRNFNEQKKAVSALGYPLHPRIEAAQNLANLLKHGNGMWAERLRTSWPELLPSEAESGPVNADWRELIDLKDAQIDELQRILYACSPTAKED